MSPDPAFLWETEALRETGPRPAVAGRGRDGRSDWRTLRQAHQATGIPIDTLRKWARRDSIPSFLDLRGGNPQRMVRMGDVVARASQLGRDMGPLERQFADGSSPEQGREAGTEVDSAPPGTMIVPIAAWDKMLMQLGNLHEAGQELAEARERAARAETEAIFLRERLAELREEISEGAVRPPQPPSEAAAFSEPSREFPARTSWSRLYKTVFRIVRQRKP